MTVKAADDGDADDESETLTHTASGGDYAGVARNLPVTITDDDTASAVDCDTAIWCADLEFDVGGTSNGMSSLLSKSLDSDFEYNGVTYGWGGLSVFPYGHNIPMGADPGPPFGIPERTKFGMRLLNMDAPGDDPDRFRMPNEDWMDWTLHLSTTKDGQTLTAEMRLSEGRFSQYWWQWFGSDLEALRAAWTDGQVYKLAIVEDPRSGRTPQVLGPPLYLEVRPFNDHELHVRWKMPQNRVDRILPDTSYKVQWKLATGNWDTPADVSEEADSPSPASAEVSSHVIGGLTGGVEYHVRVIATNPVGDSKPSSVVSGTPTPLPDTSQNQVEGNTPAEGAPRIEGAAEVGKALSAVTTDITDADGLQSVEFTYQWLADDSEIDGATGSTYTLASDDQGKAIKVKVDFTDDAGNEESLTSAPTAAVTEAQDLELQSATADGSGLTLTYNATLDVGVTLSSTAFTVNVNGSSRTIIGVGVGGSNVLLLLHPAVVAGDLVTVSYAKPDGANVIKDTSGNEADSFSGQAVTNSTNRPATGEPGITGTARVDETLTATTSGIRDADGLANATFQYRWLADDADIAQATGSTYTPASGDVGKTIKVRVSFTDDAGHAESLTSAGVGPVVAASSSQPPEATISAGTSPVEEGEPASFTISLDRPAPAALSVAVSVSDPGGALSGAPPASVAFASGDGSKTFSLPTSDDDVIEPGSAVTVSLATGSGYTLGETTTAPVQVNDDDVATWTVSVDPSDIEEGGSSTLTVSISNGKTFAADQAIGLAVTGTASGSDYTLSATELTLDDGTTSVEATVTAVDDSTTEGDETVIVAATRDGQAIGSATVTILASDAPPSTDATLSSLALSGIDIGAFSSDTSAYSASVDRDVSSTTVTAEPADDGASVSVADADGSTQGSSRTVSLSAGDNEITVTVIAEDGETTRVYTVTVTRAEPAADWGERIPGRDIDLGSGKSPSGMWSDGDDLWVVTNPGSGRIRVYSLADGAEQTARGFTLSGGVDFASALWSDRSTLWVADLNAGAVRAYGLSDGVRRADKDLDAAVLAGAGNTLPSGLWSDGATMWVADYEAGRVFAYDISSKARRESREFDLNRQPGQPYNPYGIWSDGETMVVADWIGGEILAHGLSDGQRKPDLDVSTLPSGTYFPFGVWVDGDVLWVADDLVGTLYAYAVPGLGSTS